MVRADASKVDSGDGVQWSAIDVTTTHGDDTVYVFYDRKSGVFTVRSPHPAAGPRQYEWNSFPDVQYFHAWYKNRFGFEPSPVKMLGQSGGTSGTPSTTKPKAGTPKATSAPDVLDEGGTVVRTHGRTRYEAAEDFGDPHPHLEGETESRYHVRADLDQDGVMTADFRLRRYDLPGSEGEYHRSKNLRGADEFKAAIEHFRTQDPDAVKAIKGVWSEGDNIDAFNVAYLQAKRSGSSHEDAIVRAATDTKTAQWAIAAGYSKFEVTSVTFDQKSGIFDHVEVHFRKP
jgi:hypothetical protein